MIKKYKKLTLAGIFFFNLTKLLSKPNCDLFSIRGSQDKLNFIFFKTNPAFVYQDKLNFDLFNTRLSIQIQLWFDLLVYPEGLEPPTFWAETRRSNPTELRIH